jgi:predicted NBD/HSP70 family sugar kinase
MRPPYPAPSSADARLQSVLGHVYGSGGVTRGDLGRATSINQSSVVRLVADLLDRGLVISDDNAQSVGRRGRPSDILRINPRAGYAVGLEFGRGHLVIVITDATGEVVHWHTEEDAPPFAAADVTTEALTTAVRRVVGASGIDWERVDAVGLALHDVVSARGEWVTYERFHDPPFPIQDLFESAVERSTTVEDVSRAFAEAEYRFGAGSHARDMIYVFLGSHGVGAGIFVNGRLLKSSSGVCGEIGHIIVDEDGPLCYCGSRGCLETVASHQAVIQQIQALLSKGVRMALSDREALTFADVCRAAGKGDKVATLVLHRLAQNLAIALASVVNVAGAPHIVVGGQLALAGEVFLNDLATAVRHRVIALLARDLTVKYAQLPLYAGARGVAVHALEEVWLGGEMLRRTESRGRSHVAPRRQAPSNGEATVVLSRLTRPI